MSGYPNAKTLGASLVERPTSLVDAIARFNGRYVVVESGCWEWLGWKDRRGYGGFAVLGRNFSAHRFSVEITRGALRTDRVLDHLCRNRGCVNPEHLELVDQATNIRRGLTGQNNAVKTHCPHGHAYTPGNTYVIPASGGRTCRTCARSRVREYQRRRRAA